MQRLTEQGILCGMVERWIPMKGHPGGGIRKDLFDCLDLIALRPDEQMTYGIQCGAMSGHAAHVTKCLQSKSLIAWLNCGNRFYVCSWGKRATKKKDGSKGMPRWACKSQAISWDGKKLFASSQIHIS